ncbi:tRNA uridine-5-carboxymethylaminomethyl(34) synthesis GTPase MnmE [Paroceanicella profunda]|uniref:tRNA modification GTPase MnmE n=1 Tax=Paroceanicella profunda TaxID=2579971 RepID=A0A5B8FGR6_9RHOB|nr:tRNA uridine-5-carboxymethylaminomethyl(34) synthesis GTPase MnmE [Paroceanicella profunda]QDL91307.1 tRNA uridine-5-carboxymethylaminomethyl(34) synthesis GTPase MnmE [Paroceanicella profunda]
MEDTIFALASARGKAGIAVMRVSGPRAWDIVSRLTPLPPARKAGLRQLRGSDGEILDEALVLCFEDDASFTGEPVVELHLHGAMAVVESLTRWLSGQKDTRLAEPGEFTRRALSNGRMDLAQVEGLGDLIEAETEAQRRQALRVMRGELSRLVSQWRTQLIRARALLEATIDFADEDVPETVTPEVLSLLTQVRTGMQGQVDGAATAERIRDGFEIALVGRPNAGKSTLLNALAGREAAIISSHAGTTRDIIEVRMDLQGLPVTILDMAGLRDSEDEVETIGIARARSRAESADIRIFLLPPDEALGEMVSLHRAGDILVHTKCDLQSPSSGLAISAQTGLGLSELLHEVSTRLSARSAAPSCLIRDRHRVALGHAVAHLDDAATRMHEGSDDLAAEDIRAATHAVDVLVGRVDIENVLDEIFASFCLGK